MDFFNNSTNKPYFSSTQIEQMKQQLIEEFKKLQQTNFTTTEMKAKASRYVNEILQAIENPPKKQPFLTVGNYEKVFKS